MSELRVPSEKLFGTNTPHWRPWEPRRVGFLRLFLVSTAGGIVGGTIAVLMWQFFGW